MVSLGLKSESRVMNLWHSSNCLIAVDTSPWYESLFVSVADSTDFFLFLAAAKRACRFCGFSSMAFVNSICPCNEDVMATAASAGDVELLMLKYSGILGVLARASKAHGPGKCDE